MKNIFKKSPPKSEQRELSVDEVDTLEGNLRLAAGAFYEIDEIPPPEEKAWWHNNPPGIVRRFRSMQDALLPPRKHRKP